MRRECRERFPRHRLQRKPLVSDPGMHHDTCVMHTAVLRISGRPVAKYDSIRGRAIQHDPPSRPMGDPTLDKCEWKTCKFCVLRGLGDLIFHHGWSGRRPMNLGLSTSLSYVHVWIANPRWRGKRSRHSRCMHNPQFYVSGKRPMILFLQIITL